MSKQDRQGVRTATDLERKYQFGKTFAEVIGIAEAAREAAEESKESYENLDHDEIFNLLTKNGELQGLYRGDDGNLYINAEYIKSGQLAADLIKSGVIQSEDGAIALDLSNGFLSVATEISGYKGKIDLMQSGIYGFGWDAENSEYRRTLAILPGYIQENGLVHATSIQTPYIKTGLSISGNTFLNLGKSSAPTDIYGSQVKINGGTFPEYIDGVEYQLPEKYNGKTVYTQMVSFGQMPRSGYAWKAMTDIDATKVISLEGRCFNTTEVNEFPVYLGGSLGAYCWFDISGIGVNAVQNMSEFSAEFIIKYYKD